MRSLTALCALLFSGTAYASDADDLQDLADVTEQLSMAARNIEGRVGTGGVTNMSDEEARRRFDDYLFMRLVGRHQEAAEGFFGLVTTGALSNPDLHRDAEWHLAESLYGMGNIVTAEARYRVIADDQEHPFRPEAVRRLLELYAGRGDFDAFYDVYEREIVQGRVTPTPAITYTIAKSFYQQGDLAKAQQYFNDILPEDSEHARARYFLGVIKIREGKIDEALPFFQESATISVETVDGRRIHDLSLLALARIAYERGAFLDAAINYQKVGGDSDYLDDVLFEQSWSWIKQDRYDEALQSVSIFLLAFPEHRYAGDLRVIEGHLHMGCAQTPEKCPDPTLAIEQGDAYQQALTTYEGIVEDYSPIRDTLADLGSSEERAFSHFKSNLALDGPGDGVVPEFAMAMMRDDPALDRTLQVSDRLDVQRQDLEASEVMIEQIRAVLSTDNGSGGFEGARLEAIANQARVALEQIDLLAIEAHWLEAQEVNLSPMAAQLSSLESYKAGLRERAERASQQRDAHVSRVAQTHDELRVLEKEAADAAAAIDALELELAAARGPRTRARIQAQIDAKKLETTEQASRTDALQAKLVDMQMPGDSLASDATLPALSKTVAELREAFLLARPRTKDGIVDDFDTQHSKLERLELAHVDILERMEKMGATELGKLRERFEAEVIEVQSERQDLDRQQQEADALAATVTRESLSKMEAFFADSVMKADTGIIDVYWSRKLELAEKREAIQDERNALVDELEQRFVLIRQKMEQ